jgi:endonuclease G
MELQSKRPLQARLPDHPAAKYGLPQTQTLREHDGFVAMFDSSTRNPAWVIEHVTRDKMYGEADRGNSAFYEDEALDERLRNRLSDFRWSGYDRGHLVPAANHKGHQGAMNETFCLSNISPQVGEGFNRDYWARFEKFVKDAAKTSDGLYVVTGPLFLPRPDEEKEQGDGGGDDGRPKTKNGSNNSSNSTSSKWRANHPFIGAPPNLVAVPTHFYKVVLADNDSGKHGQHKAAVGAFVMPNSAVDPQTPLEAFVVPLDALERVAGTTFFPGFVDGSRRAALDRTALALQERGRAALPYLDRQALAAEQGPMMMALEGGAGATTARGDGGNKDDDKASRRPTMPPLPTTTGGRGAVHICEHVACKLPQEKWWLEGKQQQDQKKKNGKQVGRGGGGGGNGGNGGGRLAAGGRAGSAPPP